MPAQLVKFPKKATNVSPQKAIQQWLKEQPAPKAPKVALRPVKAVPLTRAALEELRAVVESGDGNGRALRKRASKDVNTQRLLGTLYSAFTTYEFLLMKAEYTRRKAETAAPQLEQRWKAIVDAAQKAFKAGGLTVNEATMNNYVNQLQSNGGYLGAVVKLRQTAVAAGPAGTLGNRTLTAAVIPSVSTFFDRFPTTTTINDLCSTPLKQGSFTKHIAYSVTLRIQVTYWCPTWTDWFRTCTSVVTLGSASFSLDINVGYKLTCCGATAWGAASTQACLNVLFINVCAGCSGSIVGVAGVSRTPVSGGCSYGLGVTASLKCSLASLTLLDLSYNFGWIITGPCPPANVCA